MAAPQQCMYGSIAALPMISTVLGSGVQQRLILHVCVTAAPKLQISGNNSLAQP